MTADFNIGKTPVGEAPDYATYTEAELGQVLARIDRTRFPERVKQVEHYLASFAQAKSAAAPAGNACRKISVSPSALGIRLPLYGFSAVAFALLVSALIFTEKAYALMSWAALLLAAGIFGYLRGSDFQLEVFDYGDGLEFKHDGKQAYVALSHVDWAEIAYSDDQKDWIVLHLSFTSALGDRIAFYPAVDSPRSRSFNDFFTDLSLRIHSAKHAAPAHVAPGVSG
jgi:hypothetical protein